MQCKKRRPGSPSRIPRLMRPVGDSTTQQRRESCRNACTAGQVVLGLAATVHIRSMSTVGWMTKSVFSAVHPAMAHVATARSKSTNMAVETINAFIVGQPALAHVAIALMESMKSNRTAFTSGCSPSWEFVPLKIGASGLS